MRLSDPLTEYLHNVGNCFPEGLHKLKKYASGGVSTVKRNSRNVALIAGATAILSLACDAPTSRPVPTAIATPTPTVTPASFIPLQKTAPQLEATPTATPIPTPTPKPTATPTPTATPRPPKPIVIYAEPSYFITGESFNAEVSKIISYAWQLGLRVDIIRSSDELKTNINKYAGIWVNPQKGHNPMSDSTVYEISRFVTKGGRVLFEVNDEWCKSDAFTNSLRNYFNISLSCEEVWNKVYKLDKGQIPLLKNFIGFENYSLDAFFLIKSDYTGGKLISRSTNVPRDVTAYGNFGDGEVLFMIVDDHNRGVSFISDKHIDNYNNREGGIEIIRWLADSIDMP